MSGRFIQSRFGTVGNFEVVVQQEAGGLIHFWRNNDTHPAQLWSPGTAFGGGLGQVDGVSLIQSNFGSPGNLEVVASSRGSLYHLWRDSGPSFSWSDPIKIGDGVSGGPASPRSTPGILGLIQSRFGVQGNFELVVPADDVGMLHYWRNNDDLNLPWIGPTRFGASLGFADAVSLIQSNFGSPGNLEVVALASGQLHYFWRDSGPSFSWNGPIDLGISGYPSLIQSRYGTRGNFELVVASFTGGLTHYWRDNDDPRLPWYGTVSFSEIVKYGQPSLIVSNYGFPGDLDLVAATQDHQLAHGWRDPSLTWNGPFAFETGLG